MKTSSDSSKLPKKSSNPSIWVSKTGLRQQWKFGSNLDSQAAFPDSSIRAGATGCSLQELIEKKQHRNIPGYQYCTAAVCGRHRHKCQCLGCPPRRYISWTCSSRHTRLPHQDSDMLGSLNAWPLLHKLSEHIDYSPYLRLAELFEQMDPYCKVYHIGSPDVMETF